MSKRKQIEPERLIDLAQQGENLRELEYEYARLANRLPYTEGLEGERIYSPEDAIKKAGYEARSKEYSKEGDFLAEQAAKEGAPVDVWFMLRPGVSTRVSAYTGSYHFGFEDAPIEGMHPSDYYAQAREEA